MIPWSFGVVNLDELIIARGNSIKPILAGIITHGTIQLGLPVGGKPGITYGQSDDYSYNVEDGGIHVHDFHATILHLLGIDHERLTFKYQGRHFRLTDVHGHAVKPILS